MVGRLKKWWTALRARYVWLQHVLTAYSRMNRTNANQFAAAITYFSFLALFPLLLLAVSITGYVLHSQPHLQTELFAKITNQVQGTLGKTIKKSIKDAIKHRGSVGTVGLLGVLLTGLGWIGNLRQAIDAVWEQQPPKRNFITSRVSNLVVLGGLGLGVVVSVGLTAVGTSATSQILDAAGLDSVPGATYILKVIGILIAAAGDMIVFWWVLVRLPAVSLDRKTMLEGVFMASVGFEVLKIVGTYTVAHAATNKTTAGPFALPIAILVWIQLVCRFMLFCCSWMAVVRDKGRTANSIPVVEPAVMAAPPAPGAIRPATVGASLVGAGAVAGAALVSVSRRRLSRRVSASRAGRTGRTP